MYRGMRGMAPTRVCFTLLILLVVFPSLAHARAVPVVTTLDSRTSLAGDWKLALGDKPAYASREYDDSGWYTVTMPGSVSRYLMTGALPGVSLDSLDQIEGICWLRKTVIFDRDLPRGSAGLILGQIANADETYFNGREDRGHGGLPAPRVLHVEPSAQLRDPGPAHKVR